MNRPQRIVVRRSGAFASVIALYLFALAYSASRHSPVYDESAHLAAGLAQWDFGECRLYRANPPLARLVGAIPVVLTGYQPNWDRSAETASIRAEFSVGWDFMVANRPRSFWLLTIARWACIPLQIVGAIVCFLWARELYANEWSGWVALVLWCSCPNLLGHGQLITPDATGAAMGVLACYLFWRWLRHPTWRRTAWMGVGLGLALLSKSSWIVLFGVWPALLVVRWWVGVGGQGLGQTSADGRSPRPSPQGGEGVRKPADGMPPDGGAGAGSPSHGDGDRKRPDGAPPRFAAMSGKLTAGLALACLVLNAGYEFESPFTRLGAMQFRSAALSGYTHASPSAGTDHSNRFEGSFLGDLPVPVPRSFVEGIDIVLWDFERGQLSYLAGEWKFRGWWYYYLYALAVKTPLGTLALIALALLTARRYAASWQDELAVLAPAAVLFILASSQTGFSHHFRYVLPVLPFLFVWISKVGRSIECGHRGVAPIAAAALGCTVISSAAVYPHGLSYFHELAGGPKAGYRHLCDSNIDWGQDLLYLKRWCDAHPEASPLHLVYFGCVDPLQAGLKFDLPPTATGHSSRHAPRAVDGIRSVPTTGPLPGWHAVSVNFLVGMQFYTYDGKGGRATIPPGAYTYFQRFEPVATAGYSIFIYHITLDEANRVRRELGLPELNPADVAADERKRTEAR